VRIKVSRGKLCRRKHLAGQYTFLPQLPYNHSAWYNVAAPLITRQHLTKACMQPVVTSIHCTDWQRIRLQELLSADENEQRSHGGPPKILDVEVTRDMVSGCACGDDVSIIGYVRVSKGDCSSKLQNGVMILHIESISLLNHSRSDSDVVRVCVSVTCISAFSLQHTILRIISDCKESRVHFFLDITVVAEFFHA
jgi:DNA replicative helicase MCM subunit Mcm2 (Cdc46/Mcm family)